MVGRINNKGFTLIEVLGVLVILASILVLAMLSFSSSLEKKKEDKNEDAIEILESFAEIYVTDYRDEINEKIEGDECYILIKELKNRGYLINAVERLDDISLDNYIIYNKKKNTYKYLENSKGVSGLHSCLIDDIEEYLVNFDPNGGTVDKTNMKVIYGEKYGNLPEPVYKGYKFTGWYTEKDGGSKITADDNVSIFEEQTLYAHWVISTYSIVYDANGGSGITDSQEANIGTDTILKASNTFTAVSGTHFSGWNTEKDGSGVTYSAGAKYSLNESVTLYAQWERHTSSCYDITYHSHTGNSITGGGCYGGTTTVQKPCGEYEYIEYYRCNTDNAEWGIGSHPYYSKEHEGHNYDLHDYWRCKTCKYTTHQNPNSTYHYVPGIEYVLNCDKTTSTIESQVLKCGGVE